MFRCKQFVWMGNVSKIARRWFSMEKSMLKFNEDFIRDYDEDSDKGYIFEIDVEPSDLPFLSKRIKIKICSKFIFNLYDKNNCVAHIRPLKQTLDHGLILKKLHRVIQFNQEA